MLVKQKFRLIVPSPSRVRKHYFSPKVDLFVRIVHGCHSLWPRNISISGYEKSPKVRLFGPLSTLGTAAQHAQQCWAHSGRHPGWWVFPDIFLALHSGAKLVKIQKIFYGTQSSKLKFLGHFMPFWTNFVHLKTILAFKTFFPIFDTFCPTVSYPLLGVIKGTTFHIVPLSS